LFAARAGCGKGGRKQGQGSPRVRQGQGTAQHRRRKVSTVGVSRAERRDGYSMSGESGESVDERWGGSNHENGARGNRDGERQEGPKIRWKLVRKPTGTRGLRVKGCGWVRECAYSSSACRGVAM